MKKRLLITGSCGFIFSTFIRRAIYEKQPYSFVSIDRVNNNANAVYYNKEHDFHIADIRDAHTIDVIFQFERPDIVIHAADEKNDLNSLISTNVLGTQNIINACLKHHVEKLIYISTAGVYGQLINETDLPFTEDSSIEPRNFYTASKVAAELLVKAAHTSHGLTYNIIRSTSCYGPRQPSFKLIPKTIKCILQDEKIPIYGQGQQIRDWLHVFDKISAVSTILNNGIPNQIYNISANQEFNNIEIVQHVCNTMNKGHSLISFEDDPIRERGFRQSLNSDKIKQLGWQPNLKFKTAINSVTDWYLNNKYILK